jgi:hypothetical protein
VVLAGLAGGLDPDLRAGAVRWVSRVYREPVFQDGRAAAKELELVRGLVPPRTVSELGVLCSARRLLSTRAEKAELWSALGHVPQAMVDLETAAFLDELNNLGCQARVVRVISDEASEELPAILVGSTSVSGELSPWKVGMRAVVRPASWPALLRLRGRMQRGAQALSGALCEAVGNGLGKPPVSRENPQ